MASVFFQNGKDVHFSPLCVMKTSRNKCNLFFQEMHILLVERETISESWTLKKAEHWRIDAFELLCWRRLLRVPWTARRSNQSILKEISPGCSLEGLMLKLKLQYFGHLMQRVDSLEKTCKKTWFSRSAMSNTLTPHGQQQARLPCPSPETWRYYQLPEKNIRQQKLPCECD